MARINGQTPKQDAELIVEALTQEGVCIDGAVFSRVADLNQWRLYLSSSDTGEKGKRFLLDKIREIIRRNPGTSLSIFDIELKSNQGKHMFELARFITSGPVRSGPRVVGLRLRKVQIDGILLDDVNIMYLDTEKMLSPTAN